MKRFVPLLLAVCMATVALSIAAAPVKRAHISAHAAWVLHVDCDALRDTYLGKYMLYQMSKPEMRSNMLAFESIFSFDLRTQLHGFTLYSNGPTPKDSVYLIYADLDPEHVAGMIMGEQAATVETNDQQQVIYSWIDKNNPRDPSRSYGAIQKRLMIVGKDKARVSAALAVTEGKAANLATNRAMPELKDAGDGDFLVASARKLDFLGVDPGATLLKMAKRAKLRASERDEQLNAVLTLQANDEATAQQMMVAAQGMILLWSLQKDSPQTAVLAQGLSVKQNAGTVTVTLSVPSTDFVAAQKAYAAAQAKAQAGAK